MNDGFRKKISLIADEAERMLAESALSDEARARYLFRFHDRLKAIAQ